MTVTDFHSFADGLQARLHGIIYSGVTGIGGYEF